MSGGHFNYVQHQLDEHSLELRRVVRCLKGRATKEDKDHDFVPGEGEYGPVTVDLLARIAGVLDCARKLLHATDYLLCGDAGEDNVSRVWSKEKLVLEELLKPSNSEVLMRTKGWIPVREWLGQFEDDPSMRVLEHIAQDEHAIVVEELRFYAGRPAFFNTLTHRLMEVGDWDELKQATIEM